MRYLSSQQRAPTQWALPVLRCAWCFVGLSVAGGCRYQQLREAFLVEAFSADLRVLEDKVYDLSDRVDTLESRVRQLEEAAPSPAPPTRRPRTQPSPTRPTDDLPDLSPPKVEPGRPTTPDELRSEKNGQSTPLALAEEPADAVPLRRSSVTTDPHVTRLVIDERTGVGDWDGASGADGIRLIVRPLNAGGELVADGEVIAVLLDAQDRTHVARWEFDSLTVQRSVRQVEGGPAIVLNLPWKTPPQHDQLHLFVRWQSADGHRREADCALNLSQPSVATADGRWSPRAAQRPQQGPPAEVYR